MRLLLFSLAIGLLPLVSSIPVSDQPREITPNFQGKAPEAFNGSDSRIGIDPPNCAISWVHETNVVGDGAVKQWTMWKQISVSLSSHHPFSSLPPQMNNIDNRIIDNASRTTYAAAKAPVP